MVKNFKCKICGKSISGFFLMSHLLFRHSGMMIKYLIKGEDEMAKLIIKNGKLVPSNEVQSEQVIEEKKQQLFTKEEAAPVEVAAVQQEPNPIEVGLKVMAEVENETIQIAQPQQAVQQQQPQMNDLQMQEAIKQKQEYERLLEVQRQQAMQDQFLNEQKENIKQQSEQHNKEQIVIFVIELLGRKPLQFKVQAEGADAFYGHIEKALNEDKVLKIENKMIPTAAIQLVYFE